MILGLSIFTQLVNNLQIKKTEKQNTKNKTKTLKAKAKDSNLKAKAKAKTSIISTSAKVTVLNAPASNDRTKIINNTGKAANTKRR